MWNDYLKLMLNLSWIKNSDIHLSFEDQVQCKLQQKIQFLPHKEHVASISNAKPLTVFKEIIAVCCTNHTKHTGYIYEMGKKLF
jgi:hypothetical protein